MGIFAKDIIINNLGTRQKSTCWFPHDGHALSDRKIKFLVKRYGFEGYGRYFALLEKMRNESSYSLIMDEPTIEEIIDDLQFNSKQELMLFIKDLVEVIKLFIWNSNNNELYSDRFIREMLWMDHIKGQRAIAGRVSGQKRSFTRQYMPQQQIEQHANSTENKEPLEIDPKKVEKAFVVDNAKIYSMLNKWIQINCINKEFAISQLRTSIEKYGEEFTTRILYIAITTKKFKLIDDDTDAKYKEFVEKSKQ